VAFGGAAFAGALLFGCRFAGDQARAVAFFFVVIDPGFAALSVGWGFLDLVQPASRTVAVALF